MNNNQALSELGQNLLPLLILYVIICGIISTFAKDRKIGITNAFLLCVFTTPVIGAILTGTSPLLIDIELKELQLKKLKESETETK